MTTSNTKTLINKTLIINASLITDKVEAQRLIEKENKEKAYSLFMDAMNTAKEKGYNSSLPSYNNLLKKVYDSAQLVWDDAKKEGDEATAKRKALYKNYIQPINVAYEEIIANNKDAKKFYTDPRELVPFLIAQEIVDTLFKDSQAHVITLSNAIYPIITKNYRLPAIEVDTKSPLVIANLEIIRSVIEACDVLTKMDHTTVSDTTDTSRGVYCEFTLEVKSTIIGKLEETIAKQRNISEPMIITPNKHNSLHDKTGGYLDSDSPLHKSFYGKNTLASKFNSTTNKDYFNTKNSIQETPYSVNTNFLNFINDLHTEDTELVDSILVSNIEAADEAVEAIKVGISPTITPLLIESKALWTSYYKSKKDKESLIEKIKTTSNTTTKQANKLIELDSTITNDLFACDVLEKKIKEVKEPLDKAISNASKARSNTRTLNVATKYSDFSDIYLPIFVGSNGRSYYYTSDLHPQGNNLCKALINFSEGCSLANVESMNWFKFCFGTIFDGMDKKVAQPRIDAVTNNHQVIMDFVERKSNDFLSLIDSGEELLAISYAIEYYNHHTQPNYLTKTICYVDACSSAVQIQGITQNCNQCMTLTNVINPEGENLADAYGIAGDSIKAAAESASDMTDDDLLALIDIVLEAPQGASQGETQPMVDVITNTTEAAVEAPEALKNDVSIKVPRKTVTQWIKSKKPNKIKQKQQDIKGIVSMTNDDLLAAIDSLF